MIPKKVIVIIFQSLTTGSAGGMGALGYDIASQLHKKGIDVCLYTINKGHIKTPFSSYSVLPGARYFLWMINKAMKLGIVSRLMGYKIQEHLFDYFLSKCELESDILFTTFPLLPQTLEKHHHKIGKTVLIPSNPNEQFIAALCKKEAEEYGLPLKNDAYIDAWRCKQHLAALPYIDEIVSISAVTNNSYELFPGVRNLLPYYLNRTGRNHPSGQASKDPFIFLFIAHIVILKGLHHLLKAWMELEVPGAELWIAGSIDKELKAKLSEMFPSDRVRWLGYETNVNELILKSSVVVIPSLIDNEPHTAVEALALRRPLIISSGCGNAQWIEEEAPDAIYKMGDIGALKAKMSYSYQYYTAFNEHFTPLYDKIIADKDRNGFWFDNMFSKVFNTAAAPGSLS